MYDNIKKHLDDLLTQVSLQTFKDSPISVVKELQTAGADIPDIELCAMFAAMVSWGNSQRQSKEATKHLMQICGNKPAEFVKMGDFYDLSDDLHIFKNLDGERFKAVCHLLRRFYHKYGSVQTYIQNDNSMYVLRLLNELCQTFTAAHMGSPINGSACKRVNLLLRWMVRKDDIDLGIWQTESVRPQDLYAVMDADTAKIAMTRGLITYSQHTWPSVLELTDVYRTWDSQDPLKYDLVFNLQNIM